MRRTIQGPLFRVLAESSSRPVRRCVAYGSLGLALAAAAGCGDGESDAPAEVTPEVVLARDRAAELFSLDKRELEAREPLAPLVERKDAAAEDLFRALNVELLVGERSRAEALLARAEALEPDHPTVHWSRYRMAIEDGDYESALEHIRRTLDAAPDDYPTRVAYARCLEDLDRLEEANAAYRELMQTPDEHFPTWKQMVRYRLALNLAREGKREEAQPYFDEYEKVQESVKVPGDKQQAKGTFGQVLPHTPTRGSIDRPEVGGLGVSVRVIMESKDFSGADVFYPAWGRGSGDKDSDLGAAHGLPEQLYSWHSDAPELTISTPGKVEIVARSDSGWSAEYTAAGAVDFAPFDRANFGAEPSDLKSTTGAEHEGPTDRSNDLFVVLERKEGGELHLLENDGNGWSLRDDPLAELGPYPDGGRLLPADYDHDGDVDLLVTPPDGVRLLRNDGMDSDEGTLTDVSDTLALPTGDFRALAEDFDGDNDVDFLLSPRGGGVPVLLSNDRGGRFLDASATLPRAAAGRRIAAADFDGDGKPDLAVLADEVSVFRRNPLGEWTEPLTWPLGSPPTGPPVVCDWDLDGAADLVWPTAARPAAGLLAPGHENGGVAFALGEGFDAPRTGEAELVAADLDGDHDLDLVRRDGTGLSELLNQGERRGLLIGLMGHKDNARGVGAILEIREGLRYRRIYYRGTPELVGLGELDDGKVDVVRVTWPNGMVQSFFDLPTDAEYLIWQRRGSAGSCPFLYTWNGETYEFISDVLGITPLGLPMARGVLVPPDHDEFVLVKGEQLVPRDGFYDLQFTEELREVTYLDRLRLDVVDHPADVEVFPNERFTFPPFPEHHTHTVRAPLVPERAVGSDGEDWTEALAQDDRTYAIPFEFLKGQYQGLATPHFLELEFDAQRVRAAGKLRLLMNGWLFWTDASVNVAVANHPDHAFVPPLLQVPDGEGGWVEAGPPLGFPAGKLKTMVVDVTDLVNKEDPRLRIFSTLRLYWDSIRLATDDDDAPLRVTSIEPASAELWDRGFSDPIETAGVHELDWFEWDRLEATPRWNQHPGLYTKLGDTLPLVTEIDDRFVIMGAGDALRVRFDAREVPPLPEGWRRDFLVFLDGWAKDRDPNTEEALFVEPLPFHGMSGYPYGPDESFPDDEAHETWRLEWNTRPAKRWIESLVPRQIRSRTPPGGFPSESAAARRFSRQASG